MVTSVAGSRNYGSDMPIGISSSCFQRGRELVGFLDIGVDLLSIVVAGDG
jgi:hypothetical protein